LKSSDKVRRAYIKTVDDPETVKILKEAQTTIENFHKKLEKSLLCPTNTTLKLNIPSFEINSYEDSFIPEFETTVTNKATKDVAFSLYGCVVGVCCFT
jgi:hypothetical protein